MLNITKTFGSVVANSRVSLKVFGGEILSLLGENGSGKTTLMNMLSGIYFPDEGEIFVNGEPVVIRSPKDAYNYKIGMIHQHFKLVDVFTAVENIALGLKDEKSFNKKEITEKVMKICDKYGFVVNPEQKVYDMSVSQKQTLEIVKVLYRGADILILDEPTAVLTPQETEKLFAIMKRMKADGKSIIIITHKLHEVLAISDRVAILRKGEYIDTVKTSEATELSLTEMMVGKKIELNIERPEPKNCKKRLDIEHLTCINKEGVKMLDDVTFSVYSGQILGIAGISGCGQKELLESIAGLQKVSETSSIVFYSPGGEKGEQLVGKSPRAIADMGIALSFVPEDRLGMGLVGNMGMTENMMLKTYRKGGAFFIKTKAPEELAGSIKENLGVVAPDLKTPVRRLSGGNVQKVLVGREIAAAPSVLMTAYAVRGLDINTSYAIYNLLNIQKKNDVAVIFVGEDLDVLIALCDKIVVLCGGRVNGIVDAKNTTKEEIGLMMTNQAKEGGAAHE